MTNALSVKTIKAKQDALQKSYNKSRLVWDKAAEDLKAKKEELCKFKDKYGRVIAMMEADKED